MYSELAPELKDLALKNKSTAPPEMKAYLGNLDLYDSAICLTDDGGSSADCENI